PADLPNAKGSACSESSLKFQYRAASFSVRGRISIQFSLCQAVRRFCCAGTEGERLLPGKSLALVLTECDEGASKASGRMGLYGSLRRRNATTIGGGMDDCAAAGLDDIPHTA